MRERSATPELEPELGQAVRKLGPTPRRAVLLVEPCPEHQSRLARLLTVQGHRVIGTSSLDAAATLMREFEVDLLLVAEELTQPDPAAVVANLVALQPQARIVVMTPADEPISGVRPVRLAEVEYLTRPFGDQTLAALLSAG